MESSYAYILADFLIAVIFFRPVVLIPIVGHLYLCCILKLGGFSTADAVRILQTVV